MRQNNLGRYLTPVSGGIQIIGTAIILFGLLLSNLTLPNDDALGIFRYGAYVVGATLVVAFLFQSTQGLKVLLQPDSVAIFTFYFLTYAEFLSPDLRVLRSTTTQGAIDASELVMLSFAGLAIGRHLPIFGNGLARINLPELPPRTIYWLFLLFSFLGYLYVLMSVNFDVREIFYNMFNPRFATPWQRGALGDWRSLLEELNLLLYTVAAIGGYIYGNRQLFTPPQKVVVGSILLFTLAFGVGGGARNIVLIQVGLFLTAFLLSSDRPINFKLIAVLALALAGLWALSGLMLRFRNVGFAAGLGSIFSPSIDNFVDPSTLETKTMIDNNMYSIGGIMELFPRFYDYPGLDVLWTSIIHPIPRAIWPGKPVEWTDSIEGALGATNATIAVTYAGEAYLIAGYTTAFIASLLFGALAAAWGRVGAVIRTNTGLIYYVSGFYAVTLGMRSMQWITVAILPTIAVYVMIVVLRRSGVGRMIGARKTATLNREWGRGGRGA